MRNEFCVTVRKNNINGMITCTAYVDLGDSLGDVVMRNVYDLSSRTQARRTFVQQLRAYLANKYNLTTPKILSLVTN